MSVSPALRAEGLTLRLGGRIVVDSVSLRLHAGEWVAIVGPNGAGKSSLLAMLAGLREPERGAIHVEGCALQGLHARDRAQRLAWLSQTVDVEGDISVEDVVRLGRLPRQGLFGASDADDEQAVRAALIETETLGLAGRRLRDLSGGERQRVLLARALAVGAPVLLLDEPTAHLDPPHQRALWRGLLQRARQGTAVAAVMHDLTLALAADRVLVMSAGRLCADAAPHEPALHAALVEVFDGAISVAAVQQPGGPRWVALPAL